MRTARPQCRPHGSPWLPLIAAALIACEAGDAPSAAPEYTWSRDTLVAQSIVLHDSTDSRSTGDLIGRPQFVRAADGLVFVSDVSADRIAVLDSLANVVRWIGARGRGPGELLGVSHLEVRDHHLFVGEALNGRVSEFAFDGTFVRAFQSPYAAGSVSATAHAQFAISRSTSFYAAALHAHSDASNAFRRARAEGHADAGRWSTLAGHDLLAADSAHLWVLDQGTAELCEYDSPRSPSRCRSLPAALTAHLRAYRDRRVALIEQATHQHVRAAPLVKDMVRVGCWLALLLPLPELPIVLVDVTDGTLTPVLPLSLPIPPWERAAAGFAWDGRGFILVGDEGIGRLVVSLRSASR